MVEENQESKIDFPVKGYDKCPDCGCEVGIIRSVIDQKKKEGKLNKDAFPGGAALQIPLIDPTKMALAPVSVVPIVMVYFEVCYECKRLYVTSVQYLEAMGKVDVVPQGQPSRGLPRRMPFDGLPFGRG
jgi:hypothetical protein